MTAHAPRNPADPVTRAVLPGRTYGIPHRKNQPTGSASAGGGFKMMGGTQPSIDTSQGISRSWAQHILPCLYSSPTGFASALPATRCVGRCTLPSGIQLVRKTQIPNIKFGQGTKHKPQLVSGPPLPPAPRNVPCGHVAVASAVPAWWPTFHERSCHRRTTVFARSRSSLPPPPASKKSKKRKSLPEITAPL